MGENGKLRHVTFRLRATDHWEQQPPSGRRWQTPFRRPQKNMNKGSCDSNSSGDTEAEQLPMGDIFQPAPGASTGCTHLREDPRVQGSTPSTQVTVQFLSISVPSTPPHRQFILTLLLSISAKEAPKPHRNSVNHRRDETTFW